MERKSTMKEFTFKELEKYNGKNGNHHGFEAGHDLTDPLYNKSPHGDSVLSKIKQIGVIKD